MVVDIVRGGRRKGRTSEKIGGMDIAYPISQDLSGVPPELGVPTLLHRPYLEILLTSASNISFILYMQSVEFEVYIRWT